MSPNKWKPCGWARKKGDSVLERLAGVFGLLLFCSIVCASVGFCRCLGGANDDWGIELEQPAVDCFEECGGCGFFAWIGMGRGGI